MKDNFSKQAASYKAFRPEYPEELYAFLLRKLDHNQKAWDCATGNGQVAERLAVDFQEVIGTDLSQKQLEKVPHDSKVTYQVANAIDHNFAVDSFDFITVAQALHWFQGELFFNKALACLKSRGILAVWGYGLLRGNDRFNKMMDTFYYDTLQGFWDDERKWIDQSYEGIPFPTGTQTEMFGLKVKWTLEHFLGYLGSWSAVQHYKDQMGVDPVEEARINFEECFDEIEELKFPIFLKWYKKD